MNELLGQAMSWIGQVVNACYNFVVGLFLPLFPDADQGFVSTIRGWGNALSGYDMTFNVFYFVDMGIVGSVAVMASVVIFAAVAYRFVRLVLDVIPNIVELIPFVE